MAAVTEAFRPSRLRFARQRAGISRHVLAEAVGVSSRMVAYAEDGRRSPSEELLDGLAAALNTPVEFFRGPELPDLTPHAVSFRALTKMPAWQRDAALGSGVLAIELNRWLSGKLRLPESDVPRYEPALDPENAAQRLRFEWGLGYASIKNVVHLLESHGVRVLSLPQRLADVDAFSFWWNDSPIILLNTRKSAERGRFDAAHELAHLVLHADYDVPRGREREVEANRFAAALLMPRESVLSARLNNAGIKQIIAAKAHWGVAAMALTYRLHELGVITDWMYASTCRQLAIRGYRSEEPNGGPRESSKLLEKAFMLLRERGITLHDIAREMSLRPEALSELLFGLALTPIEGQSERSAPSARPKLRVVPS